MFKYIRDKDSIVKNMSGIRGIYERYKFKIEKKNLIHEFINASNVEYEYIIDFAKMIHNSNKINSIATIDIGDGELIHYTTSIIKDGSVLVTIDTEFGYNEDIEIRLQIYSNRRSSNIIVIDNTDDKHIRLDYSLGGDYTEELIEYIIMLKRYMLYMLEHVLNGGLKYE